MKILIVVVTDCEFTEYQIDGEGLCSVILKVNCIHFTYEEQAQRD